MWCQEEYRWKTFLGEINSFTVSIGCAYPYMASSWVLCLLKSSLLYVGGVGYTEKCQSSSKSPCCLLKVKTRNSLAFSERSLNGMELFNHMHCSMSTIAFVLFSPGLCELIGTEFVFYLQFVLSEKKKIQTSRYCFETRNSFTQFSAW